MILLDRASGDCDGIHVSLHPDNTAPVENKDGSPQNTNVGTVDKKEAMAQNNFCNDLL